MYVSHKEYISLLYSLSADIDHKCSGVLCRLPRELELGTCPNSIYHAGSFSFSPTQEPGNNAIGKCFLLKEVFFFWLATPTAHARKQQLISCMQHTIFQYYLVSQTPASMRIDYRHVLFLLLGGSMVRGSDW